MMTRDASTRAHLSHYLIGEVWQLIVLAQLSIDSGQMWSVMGNEEQIPVA
jgi:hypothetical protein